MRDVVNAMKAGCVQAVPNTPVGVHNTLYPDGGSANHTPGGPAGTSELFSIGPRRSGDVATWSSPPHIMNQGVENIF